MLLVKIKSDRTKKEYRYKTKRNLYQELKNLKFRGVEILNLNFYSKSQSWGKCEKLIVITE
ncbi:hypothetical protein [Terrisporobacter sp.]|uniref:hypothetical protein n=1 Tax=Terrisporobacter sp. TaxID=1965305 RepID=UPI0028969CE6|nr:hypothetical protein [Terrisporobacter sp.]